VNKFVFGPTASGIERKLLPIDPITRGDVIVLKFPEDPERDFIKRTIGLPGDTIELRNKKVYVNGKPLDEPYVHFLFPPPGDSPGEDFDVRVHYGPVTVPAGHYFMMGDNRDNSDDSREHVGYVPFENFVGKAEVIFFSTDGSAHFWEVWNWPFAIRYGRLGEAVY